MECTTPPIATVVRDFVKPIIQALSVEVTDYRMRLVTTKCLNTAVAFMYLFFGKRALADTMYCDVPNVVKRHTNEGTDTNKSVLHFLKSALTNKTDKTRFAFYVMLTDGYFVHPSSGKKVFFPGHVMVWEKVPGEGGEIQYYIYQSYINKYDFKGSLEFRESPEGRVSAAHMAYYLACLEWFNKNHVWDETMAKFWQDLTNVDTSDMLGCKPDNAFYMCFRKKPVTKCLKNMAKFVDHVLARIPEGRDDEVYGSPDTPFNAGQAPLTNREMREQFLELRERLRRG